MSHEESSEEERDLAFSAQVPDAPVLSEENVPPGRTPPPSRKSKGGMWTMLGHLIAVVLGGVTVFGVYFLFLEDLLKPPKRAKLQSSPEPAQTASEKTPSVVPISPSLSNEAPPTLPETSPGDSKADRELAANRALGLAQKMAGQNPKAAEKWFRKVMEDHPDTQAAQTAQDWLKQQANMP